MSFPTTFFPSCLTEWLNARKIVACGVADLRDFATPQDETGHGFPYAFSFAVPMDPEIMVRMNNGPDQTYADEYARANSFIDELAGVLTAEIKAGGFRAKPLSATDRTDPVHIRGDFPHKTAATRAGLGWVGRNCQLVTFEFGPWVRLGTVFTDMNYPCASPVVRSSCGHCSRCVDACPAKALKGNKWYPGIPREELLDVHACDRWKKEHYFEYHNGHNCGICSAVCPHGVKVFRKAA